MSVQEFYIMINVKIVKGFETLERRMLYTLKKKLNMIADAVKVNEVASSIDNLLKNPILQNLPKDNLANFKLLDSNISGDNQIHVIEYMTLRSSGAKTVKSAINDVLPSFLTKEVQLQYSGCGKLTKGVRKENFSQTNIHRCLEGVILKLLTTTKSEIVSTLSRWLSDAVDRDGGKQQRQLKKTR
ncbi:uncharacterized protein LOC127286300 [Leptopilina boulardi]|uniref:uncharacterized protein LOC127286300 n=1 Tax=Leptopilina boulardi TaxID=63433 RepID=UPI0021F5B425|nr:uncharacterized protein LOC127286300 [Leptopilina boulardi]